MLRVQLFGLDTGNWLGPSFSELSQPHIIRAKSGFLSIWQSGVQAAFLLSLDCETCFLRDVAGNFVLPSDVNSTLDSGLSNRKTNTSQVSLTQDCLAFSLL